MPTVFSLFAFHDEAGEEEPACGLHLYFLAKEMSGVRMFTGVALSRSDYTSHDEEVEVKITKRKELRADLDALVDKGREYMCFFHSGTCPLSFIFVERILWDDYHYPGGMRLMYLNLGFSDIEDEGEVLLALAGGPLKTLDVSGWYRLLTKHLRALTSTLDSLVSVGTTHCMALVDDGNIDHRYCDTFFLGCCAPASKCQGCIERASIGAIWDTEQVVWDMRANTEHE